MNTRFFCLDTVLFTEQAVCLLFCYAGILIKTRKQGDKAVISIANNGDGIPDEMKARVFNMFYSGANKIADSRRSLGLGLSLCRSIVNAHGGKITVSDNTPHGRPF